MCPWVVRIGSGVVYLLCLCDIPCACKFAGDMPAKVVQKHAKLLECIPRSDCHFARRVPILESMQSSSAFSSRARGEDSGFPHTTNFASYCQTSQCQTMPKPRQKNGQPRSKSTHPCHGINHEFSSEERAPGGFNMAMGHVPTNASGA